MKRNLTLITEPVIIVLAGETEASDAEEQLVRDSRLEAMNCRWDGGLTFAIPFCEWQDQFSVLSCLKKPNKKSPAEGGFLMTEKRKSLLTKKWICPIHAEPIQLLTDSRL